MKRPYRSMAKRLEVFKTLLDAGWSFTYAISKAGLSHIPRSQIMKRNIKFKEAYQRHWNERKKHPNSQLGIPKKKPSGEPLGQ